MYGIDKSCRQRTRAKEDKPDKQLKLSQAILIASHKKAASNEDEHQVKQINNRDTAASANAITTNRLVKTYKSFHFISYHITSSQQN